MVVNHTDYESIVKLFGKPPAGMDIYGFLCQTHNIMVCVLFGIAICCVLLRFYVRINTVSQMWWDDYALLFSLLCVSGTVVDVWIAAQYGAGRHVWTNNVTELVHLLRVLWVEPYVYALAVTSTKASVLMLYRRIFHSGGEGTPAPFLYWVAVSLTATYPVAMALLQALGCRPVTYFWKGLLGAEGHCIDFCAGYLTLGITNLVTEIIILALPIPRILTLKLNRRMKASVLGIFLLGGLVCFACAVRVYYVKKQSDVPGDTWWIGAAIAWSSIEASVGIISACLPTLAPLFRRDRMHSRYGGSSAYRKGTKDSGLTSGTARSHLSTTIAPSNGRFPSGWGDTVKGRLNDEEDQVALTGDLGLAGDNNTMRMAHIHGGGPPTGQAGITVRKDVAITYHATAEGPRRKRDDSSA